MVMATDRCIEYRFKSPFYPGKSCEVIYTNNPESHNMPGYYWITDGPTRVYCGMTYTGSSCEDIYNNNPETGDKSGYYRINGTQWTYCNMTPTAEIFPTCAGVRGEWRRIAKFDISRGDNCPNGWLKDTQSGVSFCRVAQNNYGFCSSAFFSTNGTSYQKVCGKARGYQKGFTASFWGYYAQNQPLDGWYVEGLSITYDNPRKHIWTYDVGLYDNRSYTYNCPCAVSAGYSPPPFVGANYYCESGAADTRNNAAYYFNDPLWDGSGCITSNCCDNTAQPWFYRDLSISITADIEARICEEATSYGLVLIDQLELYVQ